jgi:hypothetical protein
MTKWDYLIKAIAEQVELFFNLGVVICGFYALWVLFSLLTRG